MLKIKGLPDDISNEIFQYLDPIKSKQVELMDQLLVILCDIGKIYSNIIQPDKWAYGEKNLSYNTLETMYLRIYSETCCECGNRVDYESYTDSSGEVSYSCYDDEEYPSYRNTNYNGCIECYIKENPGLEILETI
jgi:hypothetical protein